MSTCATTDLPPDTVLLVKNTHCDECGKPPRVLDESKQLTLYVHNVHGEQVLVQYDRKKKVGLLRAGDKGWEDKFSIREDALYTSGVIFDFAELDVIAAAYKMWTSRELKLPLYHELPRLLREAQAGAEPNDQSQDDPGIGEPNGP